MVPVVKARALPASSFVTADQTDLSLTRRVFVFALSNQVSWATVLKRAGFFFVYMFCISIANSRRLNKSTEQRCQWYTLRLLLVG